MGMIYHIHKSVILSPISFGSLRMYQLARAYCEPSSVIREHFHNDFFELTAVFDGRGTAYTNGTATEIKKGDIYLSMPYEAHKIVSDEREPLKYDCFAFATDDDGLKKELDYIKECRSLPSKRVFSSERLQTQIETAVAEIIGNDLYSNELLGHILNQIPIYLIRALSETKSGEVADPHTHAEVLCCRMMNHIDSNICTIKNLEDLTSVFGYSYKYLSALFKKTTSQTLSEYYRQKKLDLAARSVTEGRLKIGEIAEMLNYSSAYSFSKAFSEHFGMSPRAFRKASVNKEKEID